MNCHRRWKNSLHFASLYPVLAVCLIVACNLHHGPAWAEQAASESIDFMESYCIECHTADDPSGERELESIAFSDSRFDMQVRVQEIIDQLTLGSMPPTDADQPTTDQRLEAIGQLTKLLAGMRERSESTNGDTILRRLNHREYRRTLGKLLSIDMTMFDPTIDFPAENSSHGFDNVGKSLITSGYLLENYLDAADAAVEKALAVDAEPKVQEWKFDDNFFQQQELKAAHKAAFDHRYLCLYDHRRNDKPEGAYGPLQEMTSGVSIDGRYEIEVLAEAMHRGTPYSDKAINIDLSEPFRLGIVPGDTANSDMVHNQPIEPLLAEATIQDGPAKWYRFSVPLDAGFAPRFTFENGMHDVRGAFGRVYRHHKETLPKKVRNTQGIFLQRIAVIQHGKLPHIRIHEVRIKGPIDFAWPTNTRRTLLGGATLEPDAAEAKISSFASKAFRRPLENQEHQKWVRLYRHRIELGDDPETSIKQTFKAILCSPSFLYFKTDTVKNRSGDRDATRLSDHAIAERLSYFLTSGPPDPTLCKLADSAKLTQEETLRQQVRRLLDQDDSNQIVADFLDSWLHLREVGSMPPDPKDFSVYYSAGFETEFKQETRAFFRDLIDRNASALDLIGANYSFLNRDLAKLYGVDLKGNSSSGDTSNGDKLKDDVPQWKDWPAEEFHRVEFDDRNRGGLLGQASVLTVSANGVETSPVTRGVWILENILGTPTPPPPDDVPAIEPDTRGASTIRDQLQRHRSDAACNQCHRKIDPLGFILERYDPIGRLRSHYDKRRKIPIDTAGEMPGGDPIKNLAEFKSWLLQRKDFFIRTLTSRLLTHATGREMERSDRAEIDRIVSRVRADEFPLRSLIEEVVASEIFRGES